MWSFFFSQIGTQERIRTSEALKSRRTNRTLALTTCILKVRLSTQDSGQHDSNTHNCYEDCHFAPLNLAEAVGFEPTVPFGTSVFKTDTIVHSVTPLFELLPFRGRYILFYYPATAGIFITGAMQPPSRYLRWF